MNIVYLAAHAARADLPPLTALAAIFAVAALYAALSFATWKGGDHA